MTIPLLDAAAARAGDEAAVAAGDTWVGLMERAGGHLARGVVRLTGRGYGLRVAIVVGKGDNGGDGWVAARRLVAHGATARVVAVHGLDAGGSEATVANRQRFLDASGWAGGPHELADTLAWSDVVVDALLGTGFAGDLRGPVLDACRAINAASSGDRPVVACDVPTGVSSDTGAADGDALTADLTVTFGGYKRGLLLHPGAARAGRVVLGDLGKNWHGASAGWSALSAADAAGPAIGVADDKRSRGVVTVVAGQRGMSGAAVLCTRGALHGGAGLVTTAVPAGIQSEVATAVAPAMTVVLDEVDGAVSATAADDLVERGRASDVVVAGPGLGTAPDLAAVIAALRGSAPRLVLDADALNVHRDDPTQLADHVGALILTPHERELARIAGLDDGEEAWRRRTELAVDLAARLDATVVVKGPGTVTAAPDGRVWVNPTGSSALGTGGTGDVLAGLIAAFVGRADDVPLAVARAVWVHGLAGDVAGREAGGLPDSEAVAATLPAALALTRRLAAERPTWPFDEREVRR